MNVIDLFAGAGGLSVGAYMAGASVRASVEIDPIAAKTLRTNAHYHGEIIEEDVCNLTGNMLKKIARLKKSDPLIIIGGPPCQPFSKAAYWTENGEDAAYRRARSQGIKAQRPPPPAVAREDNRRDLVMEFWRLVLETNADAFVFENVPSIKHPRNKPIYEGLLSKARLAGYEITEVMAKATSFGVPQTRERTVVIGSRRRKPLIPKETHSAGGNDLFLPPPVTAGEALEGLDKPEYFEPEELVIGKWAQHLEEIPPGWNYKALTEWAGHPNPAFVAETRFWNFLLKLSPERPSWTIAASPGPWTGPFHWKNRRLRTPELAALQGFPRSYIFEGTRRQRVRQIGNAVPVQLAEAITKSAIESLE